MATYQEKAQNIGINGMSILYCSLYKWNKQTYRQKVGVGKATWHSYAKCPTNHFIVGYTLKQKTTKTLNERMINGLKIECTNPLYSRSSIKSVQVYSGKDGAWGKPNIAGGRVITNGYVKLERIPDGYGRTTVTGLRFLFSDF